jgi:hypothetical protein
VSRILSILKGDHCWENFEWAGFEWVNSFREFLREMGMRDVASDMERDG